MGLYVAVAEIGPGNLNSSASFSALTGSEMSEISSNRWSSPPILIGSGNLYSVLHDSVVLSTMLPNASLEVNNKHNLETLIISIAPFAAGFLEVILNYKKWQNALFRVSF